MIASEVLAAAEKFDKMVGIQHLTSDVIEPENGIFCGVPYTDFEAVSGFLGIRSKVANKLTAPTLKATMTELASHLRVTERVSAVTENGYIKSLVEMDRGVERIGSLQMLEQLDAMLEKAGIPIKTDKAFLEGQMGTKAWLNFIWEDTDFQADESSPGDILRTGFSVVHDMTHGELTRIDPVVWRLICSNGAVMAESLRSGYALSHHDFPQVGERIGFIRENSTSEINKVRQMKQARVEDKMAAAFSMSRNMKLRSKVSESFFDAVARTNPIETMYDLWNCLTSVANMPEHAENAFLIQSKAGNYAMTPRKVCDHCNQVVR